MAKRADVIVLAIGGNEQTSREAWNLKHMGDRTSLDLIGRQNELVDAMVALGKPIVALLFNGRPLAITSLAEKVPAILECWYLGQETGHAIADVLFGEFNPGGKLPITIPRSAGHLPAFYNYKPSARRGYLFDDVTPLYPFGFGLSYTTFSISNVRLAARADRNHRVDACAGRRDQHRYAPRVRGGAAVHPRSDQLRDPADQGAARASRKCGLNPGETTTVDLAISPASLAFYDIDMNYVVEPGEFAIMVGTSSRDSDLQSVTLRVDDAAHGRHA